MKNDLSLLARMFLVLCFGAVFLTGGGSLLSAQTNYQQNTVKGPSNALGDTSDSQIWRQIRKGMPGQVSIPDTKAGVLIQSEGEQWRLVRNGFVATYGGWILVGLLCLIVVYYLIRGRIRVERGMSGLRVNRFSQLQRLTHWLNAALFMLLGFSGLILLYGKFLLIPLIGKAAYGAVASAAMQGHNLFGPLFIPALIMLFVGFLRGNFFHLRDLKWLANFGGFFSGHPSSGRYNFGEKSWFWWTICFGGVLCVSGILLDFPWLAPERQVLQVANLAHAVSAIMFIVFGLGHIYLGTIGTEGSLESMTTGSVDVNWAWHHHDAWLDEIPEEEYFRVYSVPKSGAADEAGAE